MGGQGEGGRPGPATLLAKGYASLFQKTLRKGLFFSFLYVLDFGKKGLSLKECQQFRKKGSFLRHFHWKSVILWCFKSPFLKKGGLF